MIVHVDAYQRKMKTVEILFVLVVIINTNEVIDGVKIVYLNTMEKHNTASMLKSPKNNEFPCREGFRPDVKNEVCRRMIEFG